MEHTSNWPLVIASAVVIVLTAMFRSAADLRLVRPESPEISEDVSA